MVATSSSAVSVRLMASRSSSESPLRSSTVTAMLRCSVSAIFMAATIRYPTDPSKKRTSATLTVDTMYELRTFRLSLLSSFISCLRFAGRPCGPDRRFSSIFPGCLLHCNFPKPLGGFFRRFSGGFPWHPTTLRSHLWSPVAFRGSPAAVRLFPPPAASRHISPGRPAWSFPGCPARADYSPFCPF